MQGVTNIGLNTVIKWTKWLGKNAVVAGAIGGIVFASISPFLTPALTNWHADTGLLVEKPDIEVSVDGPSGILKPNESATYLVRVKNTQGRLAEDLQLTFYFKGCPFARGFYSEVAGRFSNPGIKLATSDCFEIVYIPNLARGEEIYFEYKVQGRQPSNLPPGLLISAGEHTDFGYKAQYQWNLNGMTYAEEETESMNVTDGYT